MSGGGNVDKTQFNEEYANESEEGPELHIGFYPTNSDLHGNVEKNLLDKYGNTIKGGRGL